ncbi:hypothetical protein P3S68_022019 [Capsicum galapagoense]
MDCVHLTPPDPTRWEYTGFVVVVVVSVRMESSCLPATLDSLTHASEANTPSEAIYILYRILENPSSSSEALRIKELAIFKLCDLLSQEKWAEDLKNLPIHSTDGKKEYSEASTLLSRLIKEVRRLDDKLLLIEIDLLESKLHFSLKNLPKAKAALTAARTAASAFYIPTDQQGEIDLQSGILHAQEKGYKVAYSYFYEAFETFNAFSRDPKDTSSKKDPDAKAKAKAIYSLKYMLLCKIMVSQADDVAGIISWHGLEYLGPELDAMKAVADAYSRLIEPFSRVEIANIAELIELPADHVVKKLSQMILDKKFAGTLDQGAGCLVIFEDPKRDVIYPATLETISSMGKVVDSLFIRSSKIMVLSFRSFIQDFVLLELQAVYSYDVNID